MHWWATQIRRGSGLTIKTNLDVLATSVHSGAGKFCCAPCQSQLWAGKCVSELTWCSTLFMRPGERQLRGMIPFIPGQVLKGVLRPRWVCWPLGGWSEMCHALPLTRLFMLVCWRGSLNKDMSPQKAPVLRRVSSENPQPALCWTSIQALHGLAPTLLICSCFSISNTLTSPKTTTLSPENKPHAAGMPVICDTFSLNFPCCPPAVGGKYLKWDKAQTGIWLFCDTKIRYL